LGRSHRVNIGEDNKEFKRGDRWIK